MKRAAGGQNQGYTILETMIFLAVSAAMFVSAAALISGRQNRTEFVAAVRNFQAQMSSIANNVSNGYYSSGASDSGSLGCRIDNASQDTASLTITTVPVNSSSRGVNSGCTFIGETIQFAPAGTNKEQYAVYNMAGLQYLKGDSSYGPAQDIKQSKAVAINTTPDSYTLGGGATIGCVLWATTSPTINPLNPCTNSTGIQSTPAGAITYLTTYQASDYYGNAGGSNNTDLFVPIDPALQGLDKPVANAVSAIANFSLTNLKNPSYGVYICLQSGGTKQHSVIQLGGQSNGSDVNGNIVDGDC